MMDMNILPDAAPAAPGGHASKSSTPSHEDGFDAFNVTLRDVLDRASAGEDDLPAGGDGGDTEPDAGATPLSALWLRLAGGPSGTDAPEGPVAEEDGAAPDTAVDEIALAIAATAMAAVPVSPAVAIATVPAVPVGRVGDNPITGEDLPADGASNAAVENRAVASTSAPGATLTMPAVESADAAATAWPSADDQVPGAPVDESSRTAGEDDRDADQMPRVNAPRFAAGGNTANAPASTPTPTPSATPPATAAPLVEELKAVATVEPGPSAQVTTAAVESVPSTPAEPHARDRAAARQGGSPFAATPFAPAQEIDSVVRHASRRDTDGEHRQSAGEWLRRSSLLESRLSPPSTFTVPTTAAGSPVVPVTTSATTYPVTVPSAFEMPAPAQNLSRLVQSMQVQARDGISQASLRLHPEHLGEVTIAIRVENGAVTALVRAEHGDVRQWLRGQEEAIRSGLAEQGLTLDELVVEDDARRQQQDQQHEEQRQKRGSRRRAPSANFEVIV